MATYSDKSFDADRYNSARPSYPDTFYQALMEYHDKGYSGKKLAVDIGCGSGFVTFKLANYFDKVIGTDLSSTMIEQCNKTNKMGGLVEFLVGPAEQSPTEIKPNSVNLLTGAECCHWVDHAKFFKESHRVLETGGTLAYWFYKDPVFVDFPEANQLYDKYCYGEDVEESEGGSWDKFMGPSWEQPGRNLLRTLLKEVEVPKTLFTDVIRHEYNASRANPHNSTPLYISRKVNLNGLKGYVKSWSAYHTWVKAYGDAHEDVADRFIRDLKETMGWDDDFVFELVWDTVYTFARSK